MALARVFARGLRVRARAGGRARTPYNCFFLVGLLCFADALLCMLRLVHFLERVREPYDSPVLFLLLLRVFFAFLRCVALGCCFACCPPTYYVRRSGGLVYIYVYLFIYPPEGFLVDGGFFPDGLAAGGRVELVGRALEYLFSPFTTEK